MLLFDSQKKKKGKTIPRSTAETFERSRSCGHAATAVELQPQVFYEKFHFQNMSKKITK